MSFLKKNWQIITIWLIFEMVAISLTLFTKNKFYLFNFTYIGSCIAIGLYLYSNHVKFARNMVQIAVGLYMLVYLGILSNENMQIEGFWYYLFLGVFEAAVIHYLVAKIAGPLFFGRGWCGYACWTAMILDLLPYKTPKNPRLKIGFIRYIMFIISLTFVSLLFILKITNLEKIMFYSFIIGNIIYYLIGITLALILKDNRAFCKYICPITLFLKPASYFAIMRVKCDDTKCIKCKKCLRNCPMNVDMLDNKRSRKNGTECILCMKCIDECPKKALHL